LVEKEVTQADLTIEMGKLPLADRREMPLKKFATLRIVPNFSSISTNKNSFALLCSLS
jgi:hypothetical protein